MLGVHTGSAAADRWFGPFASRATSFGADTARGRAWRRSYVRRIVAGDALAAAVAGAVALLIRFGITPLEVADDPVSLVMAVALPVVWVTAMLIVRSYAQRFLWTGAEEFRRVFGASALLLAVIGTGSWALDLDVSRGFVVVALPAVTLLTVLQRYGHRKALHRRRRQGEHTQATLIAGHRDGVAALRKQIEQEAYHGYRVVGCCLPVGQPDDGGSFQGIPVLGGLGEVADVVARHGIHTVALLPCPELDGPALRRLGWRLEETDAELLLAPAVTDVVGTRIAIRPVCGLPLLHMERPELAGARRLVKAVVDRLAAALLLVLMLPTLVTVALAIWLNSPGPVLFRQERVGRDGQHFQMLKFRTMVVGAERMVPQLPTARDAGNDVLFKLRADPRRTPVGRTLRRYSLDELPQLVNVLKGEMSLVGPRPPLPAEVERYGPDMRRRFLVKPGITGLWQVSGRSDLSWDDSVRIDLRYVENWSLTFDLMILWKTVGAVIRGRGAY